MSISDLEAAIKIEAATQTLRQVLEDNSALRAELAAAKALLREARGCLNEADGAYSYRDLISAIDAAIGGVKWTSKEMADADAEAERLHAAIPINAAIGSKG